VKSAENVGIVAATETGIEIGEKEDDPGRPTTVPPAATMKQIRIPPVETTGLANEWTDTALDGTNVNGIEIGIPGDATTTDHTVAIETYLMTAEVEEALLGETAIVVEEKTVMNLLPRLVVARTAPLPRRENPLQTSQISCPYWIGRGALHSGI